MSRYELETVGISVYGQEEDYLLIVDDEDDQISLSMSELLKYALVRKIPWQVASAIEFMNDKDYADGWKDDLERYQAGTGRNLPPLYKIKFVIEAEELPIEESEKLWKEYGERNNARE